MYISVRVCLVQKSIRERVGISLTGRFFLFVERQGGGYDDGGYDDMDIWIPCVQDGIISWTRN